MLRGDQTSSGQLFDKLDGSLQQSVAGDRVGSALRHRGTRYTR
jgi:hypothetical protein